MDTSMMKNGSAQIMMQFVRRMLLEVNTSIPAEIVAFDASLQTATVKPCIRGTSITNEGKTVFHDLPQILQVPVFFPYSTTSGFSITYPVKPGDQCLLIFSQRSFDNWLEKGSVQNPSESNNPRSHCYSDALALIGFSPNPMSIRDFQEDGIEIRNVDRNSFIKVAKDAITVHEKYADIVVAYNGDTTLLIRETELIGEEWLPTGAVSTIRIGRDGSTTVASSKAINIASSAVNITASSAVNITGNLIVTGNLLAKTYSVGTVSNKKDGVSGTKDKPQCEHGLVVGGN